MDRSPQTILAALVVLLLQSPLVYAAQDAASPLDRGPANLDFEEGEPDSGPPGWFQPGASAEAGYAVERTEKNPKKGSYCVLIRRDPPPPDRVFGNVMQTIEAAAYRGHVVRFRAAVRTDVTGAASRAQLWLRVDRPDRQMGFFDNMGDRPITCTDWQYFEIMGPVAEDAADLNFGCMLIGAGKVWLDDISFDIVSEIGIGGEPPRPLQGRAPENLIAFARLLGYVRYFHPSDEAVATDWESFAIEGVRLVEGPRDAAELAEKLTRLFAPIAPTVCVFPSDVVPPEDRPVSKSTKFIAWRHHGVGISGSQTIYSSQRVNSAEQEGLPDPAEPFRADLGGGVSCRAPLSLNTDESGTLPRATALHEAGPHTSPKGFLPSGNDRATRLAAVILAWNVFQHFYPYFDVVPADWPAALSRALASAATDKDERAFLDTLRRLVAELDDGHGGVHLSGVQDTHRLPVLWEWVENRLVVTQVAGGFADQLRLGDVVLKVDGKPSHQALTDCEALISGATPQWKRFRALDDLANGNERDSVLLDVQRGRAPPWNVTLTRTIPAYGEGTLNELRPEEIDEVEPGIFYLDLCRIGDEQFADLLPRLERAQGIVFDVRGYPKVSTLVIAHLIAEPVTCARWHVPIVTRPDRQDLDFDFANWTVQPVAPRLTAPVAFLTDGRAISYAETFLGIVEHYKLGEIVGGATAGTNGNVNTIRLPGGYQVSWTGMKVLKHDGSQHHGIGILPTIPVSRTVEGISAGRDEVLERAIAWLHE